MAVYLDTNALLQRAGASSLELNTAIAVCGEAGVGMVLPSIVRDEVESHRQRVIESAFDALTAAHREARRQAPIGALSEFPNPGELAREYGRGLEKQFSVVEPPEGAAAEALRRETFRLRPARGGKGARDAAIWLSVSADHLARSEDGYFVSDNSRDFAEPGKPAVLHRALSAEVSHHGHPLTLVPSLNELVAMLATTTDPFLDEAELKTLPAFRRAGAGLVHDPTFLGLIEPPSELTASEGAKLYAGSEVVVELAEVSSMNAFSVGGRGICVSRLQWDLSFELGVMEKGGLGRVQKSLPVSCRIVGLVWLGEGVGGADTEVEITHVMNVKATAL